MVYVHVHADNSGALRLYRQLGFQVSRDFALHCSPSHYFLVGDVSLSEGQDMQFCLFSCSCTAFAAGCGPVFGRIGEL